MPDSPAPTPTAWLICRPEVRCMYVGPFASHDDAVAWQKQDEAANGELSEWTAWPLYAPEVTP